MRHEGPRSLICSGRRTSATVALVVCTVATATALAAGRWSAIVLLIAVAAALGSYWWMVTAEARRPALRLRAVVIAIAVVLGVGVTMAPQRSGDVWSYAMYGRIVAVHHASPYRHLPDEYPRDPFLARMDAVYHHTPSRYGPLFSAAAGGVAAAAHGNPLATRLLFQGLAALAALA